LRYSCGHVSTKKNVRGIKDAATSTPPQLRSSRYIRYRDNIGYPRYGERYDIGDNQYSSNNLSYCPINRFLESVTTLTPKRDLNPHDNERYDIDAAFCETGVWYTIHLKPGYIMYLPMHWWHQVSHTGPLAPIVAV
jgi:hypothetical protein